MEAQIRDIANQFPGAQVDLKIALRYPVLSVRPDQIDIDVFADGQLIGRVDFTQ